MNFDQYAENTGIYNVSKFVSPQTLPPDFPSLVKAIWQSLWCGHVSQHLRSLGKLTFGLVPWYLESTEKFGKVWKTPPKFNSSPQKLWLEYDFPIGFR